MPRLSTFGHTTGFGKPSLPTPVQIESGYGTVDAYVVKYNTSGKALWAARIASSGESDIAHSTTTDSSGNIYVTGALGGTGGLGRVLTFYNSDGTSAGTIQNLGGTDIFIVKYNSSGFVLWDAMIGGTAADIGYGTAVDPSGNVVITGSYTGTLTLYNANGTAFGTTLANAGSTDIFVAKYSTLGAVQWGARISTTTADVGYKIATDSAGDIFVCATHTSTATLYNANGTAFGTTIATAGGNDALFAKYNSSGAVQWGARVGFAGFDVGYAVATDPSGNVYFSGQGSGGAGVAVTAYNSNGTAFATTLPNGGQGDAWVVKYNTSGFVQWFVRIASSGVDQTFALATDSGGNVYASGFCASNPTIFNPDGSAYGTITGVAGGDIWLVKYDTNGNPQWFTRVGSTVADYANALATDSSDNVYLVGQINTGATSFSVFNSSAAGGGLASTLTISGESDGFLIKYNSSGAVQWTRKIASSGADIARGVAVDGDGNIIACGQFTGGAMSLYGRSVSLFSTLENAGGEDAIVVKYNKNGAPQWAARIAAIGTQQIFANASDSLGNVYVTGIYLSSTTIPVYNADGTVFGSLPSSTVGDIFIIKYNSIGVAQWIRLITGSLGNNIGIAMATDSSGNIHVAGLYRSTINIFNADGSVFRTLTVLDGSDGFVLKYDTNGNPLWAARIVSSQGDRCNGISVDSSGNVYVTGLAGISVTTIAYSSNDSAFKTFTSQGNSDAFILKYNSDGIGQWGALVAGTAADLGNAIATDSSGNVYITGVYAGAASVYGSDNVAVGSAALTNVGLNDVFVVKYNTNGAVQWSRRMGSSAADIGQGIAVDSSGNVYVTGSYEGTLTIFLANGFGFASLTHVGLGDGFLVKYDTNGNPQWACRMSSTSLDRGFAVATDSVGNVYVSGTFGGAGVFLTVTRPDETTGLTTSGATAIIKFDTYGVPIWSQSINNLGSMRGASVTPYGDCYVGGISATTGNVQVMNLDNTIYKVLSSVSASQEVYFVKYSSNGIPQWAALLSGTGTDQGVAVAIDTSGNAYLTGNFTGTMTAYNANGSAFGTTLANAGSTDMFVAKYSSAGAVLWVARIASTAADVANGIATDSSGNVYVSGQYIGTATVYNANGTAFSRTLVNSGLEDGCLIKYNSSGTVLWVTRLSSTASDSATRIVVGSNDNVYVAGQHSATLTAYNSDGSAFATTLANSGQGDGFVVVYNSAGTVQWLARMSGTGIDSSWGIGVDSSNNVYVSGIHGASLTIYNSNGTAYSPTLGFAGGNRDCFLVKYNSTGTVQWVTRLSSTAQDETYALAVDSNGNCYITGYYGATLTIYNANVSSVFTTLAITTGDVEAYIVKYNSNGIGQWAGRVGTAGSVAGDTSLGVALDPAGNVIITGASSWPGGLTVYNPSNGQQFGGISSTATIITSQQDTYILKYDSTGAVQWMSSIGGAGVNHGQGLATDADGSIYVTGYMNQRSPLIASDA